MRALGTLRRKPSLETEVREVIVTQPSITGSVALIPGEDQEELSSDFDTSVELT